MFSVLANAETTDAKYIWEINIDAATGNYYYKAADSASASINTGWGGSGACSNATYAYTHNQLQGRKEILSVALSAKAMGKAVQFIGTCDSNGNYLKATRIIMK